MTKSKLNRRPVHNKIGHREAIRNNALQKFTDFKTEKEILDYLTTPDADFVSLYNYLFKDLQITLESMQANMKSRSYGHINPEILMEYDQKFKLVLHCLSTVHEVHPCQENKELLESTRRDQYTINRRIILNIFKEYALEVGWLQNPDIGTHLFRSKGYHLSSAKVTTLNIYKELMA